MLAAAQIHAPPELNETSPIYWVGSDGALGSGPSAFAISDIAGALTPASGGGGGFSGGGFSGGGG